jgi:hypothetical protein
MLGFSSLEYLENELLFLLLIFNTYDKKKVSEIHTKKLNQQERKESIVMFIEKLEHKSDSKGISKLLDNIFRGSINSKNLKSFFSLDVI